MVRDICTKVEKVPVIFLGEVTDGGLEEGQDAWSGAAKYADLRVVEAFRGVPLETKHVVIQLAFLPGMCSPMPYRKGHLTLVFVGRDDHGTLHDGGCTESRLADLASEDLAYVRSYFKGQTKTAIRGSIAANAEPDMVEYLLSAAAAALGGARVTAEAGGKRYTTTSDSRGKYEISGLPAGTYNIGAELDGFTSRDGPFKTRVNARGCAVQDIGLWSNNSVEGFLYTPRGSPVSGLPIFLQKVGQKEKWGEQANSNAQGGFLFERIDPGEYRLIISPNGPTADSPFETFAYRSAISISPKDNLNLGSVILPDPIATHDIRVELTWPDGKPVENHAQLMCSQVGFENAGFPQNTSISSKNGVAVCPALADRSYRIRLVEIGLGLKSVKLSEAREAIIPPGEQTVNLHFQLSPLDAERAHRVLPR
jgi:hypothetical protein